MLQATMLFMGALGLVTTGVAVATTDDGVAIVAGVAGTIVWGVFTYGALNPEVATDSGVQSVAPMSGVALVGLMMAIPALVIALTGPTELVGRATDASTEDL